MIVANKHQFSSPFSQFLIVICAGLYLLIGCQNHRPKGHWYQTSPHSSAELGVIVDHVPKDHITGLVNSKQISARVLSTASGTYEIYGLNPSEIPMFFPEKVYTKNRFLDFNDPLPLDFQISPEVPSPLPQLKIIEADNAQAHGQGEGVVIGVIDTGLAWNHTDFEEQKKRPEFSVGWNFGDSNTDLTDPTGHGTSVTGLIASKKLGVAPKAQVIPLKVINSAYRIDEASVIAAIRFALEHHIRLIHFSLGRPTVSELFLNLIKEVEATGSLIIAAAGNQGSSCDLFKQYPAGIDSIGVLSIGATLLDLENPFRFAPYSNFGDCIAIAAPGGSETQGLWAPLWKNSSSVYRTVVGTSMAAPLATGAIAITKSLHPDWNGSQLKTYLIDSSRKSPELEGYVKSNGLLRITF